MSERKHHYVLEDEHNRAMRNRAAAQFLLPDVIDGMPPEAWDALIAEGDAAKAADVKEGTDAGRADGLTWEDARILKEMTRAVRNIGKAQFQGVNKALYDRFMAVPAEAETDYAVLDQAERMDTVWALHPEAATWEPKAGLTRAVYQAQIAKVRTDVGSQMQEETEASGAAHGRNEVAEKMHHRNVRWFTVASSSYPKGSPQWNTIQGTITHEHAAPDTPQPPLPTP